MSVKLEWFLGDINFYRSGQIQQTTKFMIYIFIFFFFFFFFFFWSFPENETNYIKWQNLFSEQNKTV